MEEEPLYSFPKQVRLDCTGLDCTSIKRERERDAVIMVAVRSYLVIVRSPVQ